eukprot:6329837-Amphidinium_carterae.1
MGTTKGTNMQMPPFILYQVSSAGDQYAETPTWDTSSSATTWKEKIQWRGIAVIVGDSDTGRGLDWWSNCCSAVSAS